jgi:hypothetical protein
VLFTGAAARLRRGTRVARAAQRQVSPRLDADPVSATRILDQQAIAAIGMTPVRVAGHLGHDMLIIPTLTVNMVAKVAHGIGDCLASNVIAEFIMRGKPVVVATNAACPDSPDKRGWFPDMPDGYAAHAAREPGEPLASFGVRLTSADRLDAAVAGARTQRCQPRPGGPSPRR